MALAALRGSIVCAGARPCLARSKAAQLVPSAACFQRLRGSRFATGAEDPAFLKAVAAEAEAAVRDRAAKLAHVGPHVFTKDDFNYNEDDPWRHTDEIDNITPAEVALAKRCHGAHLETLSQEVTRVGSHFQLIHYDVPYLDPQTHRLKVSGLVDRELDLSMSEIRSRPAFTRPVLLACAGMGRVSQGKRLWTHVPWLQEAFGCAEWTGCSLADVLREAGIQDGAAQVVFTGADRGVEGDEVQHFQRSLSVDDALLGHVMLCYQMNGQDLEPAHGAPLRIIVPGWHGMASVKWLTSIEVTSSDWYGYQMKAYSFRRSADDPGMVPVTRLPVRALMAPPGYPDFFSRTRILSPGRHRIVGKAWSGAVDLDRVEFSSDGGKTWAIAELSPKNGPFGWASWHYDWEVFDEGGYVLACRAYDVRGRRQDLPGEDQFDFGAFAKTSPQTVYVKVDKAIEAPGSKINMTVEHRAARKSLNKDDEYGPAMDQHFVDALYRTGSQ